MGHSPPPTSDLSHYLNLSDAVELGYGGYQTLRRYIADGQLPAVKIGGRVKVLRADLDALAVPKQPVSFETVEAAVEEELSRPVDWVFRRRSVGCSIGRVVRLVCRF